MKPVALKLPGLDPGRPQHQVHEREAELVARIRRALQGQGYAVQRVGQYRADLTGNDRGVADLLIRHPGWPPALWLQCEVKLPGEPVPLHQQALAEANCTVIARSVVEALEAARQASEALVDVLAGG